ncbi:hypothetical protein Scep_010932 [Stephania cephalantha]|uniref:Glycoside hydrolase family 19 catalytic domain-containing protein n=1 Tax=Stephania cephalantha TaxID=152367 RepID=A0AAP0PHR6_9MAGN
MAYSFAINSNVLPITFVLAGILAALLSKTISGQSIANIVTPEFFDGIIGQADVGCEGKGFYSRDRFIVATKSYPQFGSEGSEDVIKREIAALFAHFTHETGRKAYFGRGPIQLAFSFNYGIAGKSIGLDLLRSPETVGNDPVVAFKTGLWFWMNTCHSLVTSGKGFGGTIRAINGFLECDGRNPATVRARVGYYIDYCNKLGVSPGDNLYC